MKSFLKSNWFLCLSTIVSTALAALVIHQRSERLRQLNYWRETAELTADIARYEGVMAGYYAAKLGRSPKDVEAIADALKNDNGWRGTGTTEGRVMRAARGPLKAPPRAMSFFNPTSNTVFWARIPTIEDAAKESVRGAVTNANGSVVTWDRSDAKEIIEANGNREIILTSDGGGETNDFDLSNLWDDGCCEGKVGSMTTNTP